MFSDLLPAAHLVECHAADGDFPEADSERGTTVLHYGLA
jgi:hypothetical protein